MTPPVGSDRMGYYHALVCLAKWHVLDGELTQAVLIQRAADDVADDLVAELGRDILATHGLVIA